MSNTETTAAASNGSTKAYNLDVNVQSVTTSTTTTGTPMLRAKVGLKLRGRDVTRTLIAQGKAFEAVKDAIVEGANTKVRALFARVQNEDGSEGGEFLTAVGLPLAKAA